LACAVAETQGQFRNPEEAKHQLLEDWKQLLGNGSEDVTVDTSYVCKFGIVKCRHMLYMKQSNKSSY
jgi:hypothetical protein